ncbi:Uncharacterised protein [Mycobacterium tuberculosis]|uniref:Uncharacterized protein n=1 Tax=Mycobacterium tuberculosis TaxID=1773 RepID=A0A655J787_MYCTX|nr:Uncharacterised protein [Mycobacterium tuberculosis]CKV09520.1 Uncharacterised protein [Mycobacterium tuberculosis]CNM55686.1 Uncharacterised protein [Mycobacterium tuberculosis]COV92707.1 Uncharacterised protein [Mycobacterium tuberculosis]COV96739.1 Uncharacterised protein [Mycobacterium tuberculosis]
MVRASLRRPEARSRTLATACDTVMFGRTVSVSGTMWAAAQSSGQLNKPRSTIARSSGSNVSSASRLGSLNSRRMLAAWSESRASRKVAASDGSIACSASAASLSSIDSNSSTALVPSSSGPSFPSSALDNDPSSRARSGSSVTTSSHKSTAFGVPIPMTWRMSSVEFSAGRMLTWRSPASR